MGYRAENPKLRKFWVRIVCMTLKSKLNIQYQNSLQQGAWDICGDCDDLDFEKLLCG